MSRKCPACGFDSPDAAAFCDFCKEPFVKKPKPADPLAGLTKEQAEKLPAADLLKKDLPPREPAPAWLRPAAWTFLAVMLLAAGVALFKLYARYQAARG
jgi:hypothetical protein